MNCSASLQPEEVNNNKGGRKKIYLAQSQILIRLNVMNERNNFNSHFVNDKFHLIQSEQTSADDADEEFLAPSPNLSKNEKQ